MKAHSIYKIFVMLAPMLLWAEALLAQVQITTHVLPPYQSRIADYVSRPELMLVTVTNTTTQELNIQLTAKITGDNGISAWVKPGYRSPNPIVLGPNQTASLNGSDIAFLFDVNTIEYTGISRSDMTRGLGLLEGNYTLCIRALDYQTMQPMSPNEPIGCTMFRISDLEPPRILMPMHQQTVSTRGVQAMPITWATPPGSSPHIQYKVKIVEMVVPRDPNDAIQSTPPIYEETVNGNSLLYGPAHPTLIRGRQYAMIVQAVDPSGMSFFRNKGMSEAIAFTYGDPIKAPVIMNPSHNSEFTGAQQLRFDWNADFETPPNTRYTVRLFEMADSAGQAISAQPLITSTVANAQQLTYDPVTMPALTKGRRYRVQVTAMSPHGSAMFVDEGQSSPVDFRYGAELAHLDTAGKQETTIRGRLVYRFKGDASGATYPIANQEVYLSKVYGIANIDEYGISSIADPSMVVTQALQREDMMNGESIMTDADGNFELKIYMSSLDSAGIIPTEKWEENVNIGRTQVMHGLMMRQNQEIGKLKGQLGVYYKVKVNNPHFLQSQEYLQIQPGAVRDLDDVMIDANSYSLSINVREVFNGLEGDYVSGAKIRLYRERRFKEDKTYGIPLYEGDITNESTLLSALSDDKVLIAERTTPELTNKKSAEAARIVFNNLFKNLPADAYQYKLELVDGSFVAREMNFSTAVNAVSKTGHTNTTGTDAKTNTNNLSALSGIQKAPEVSFDMNKLIQDVATNNNKDPKAVQTSNTRGLNGIPTKAALGSLYGHRETPRNYTASKWTDYGYRDRPEIAYLTLKKELHTPPRTKVTGKLNYAFKNMKGVPEQPYANMKVKLMVFYEYQKQNTSNTNNTTMQVAAGATNFYTLSAMVNLNGTPAKLATGNTVFINGKDVADNGKVLQTVTTDAQGNFEFDFPNSDLNGTYESGVLTNGMSGDLYGASDVTFRRVYRIVPDEPYYCALDENVIVQPWESKDMGTLVSFVRTYNLRVNVSKVDKAVNPTSATAFPHVPVALYRDIDAKAKAALPTIPGLDLHQSGVSPHSGLPNSGITSAIQGVTTSDPAPWTNAGQFASLSAQGIKGPNLSGDREPNKPIGTQSQASTGKRNITAMAAMYTPNVNATFTGVVINNGMVQNVTNNGLSALYSYTKVRDMVYSTETSNNSYVLFENVVTLPANKPGYKDSYVFHADNKGRTDMVTFEGLIHKVNHRSSPMNMALENEKKAILPPFGYQISDQEIVFNHEFDPNVTLDYALRLVPKPTAIRGRVTDKTTTLGIKGVQVKAQILINGKTYQNQRENFLLEDWATTDEQGYYSFESLAKRLESFNPEVINTGRVCYGCKNNVSILSAPGFERQTEDNLPLIPHGLSGEQINVNFDLNPLGTNAYGYVMDAETNRGVTARVKMKVNGKWVDTFAEHEGSTNTGTAYTGHAVTFAAKNFENTIVDTKANPGKATTIGKYGSIQTTTTTQGQNATGISTVFKVNLNTGNNHVIQSAFNSPSYQNGNLQIVNAATNQTINQGTFSSTASQSLSTAVNETFMVGSQLIAIGRQKFVIDLPTRPDSIIIMPYDPAYLTLTAAVNPSGPGAFLGDFKLQKRKHKIKVRVKTTDGRTVPNASVYIEGAGEEHVNTNGSGEARFEFVNNSKSNFNIYVKNRGVEITANGMYMMVLNGIPFIPTSKNNVHSEDDLRERVVDITVMPAVKITGTVRFAQSDTPVKDALVYLDLGQGSNSESQAYTNANGRYELLIPKYTFWDGGTGTLEVASAKIKGSYHEDAKTYVGTERMVNMVAGSSSINDIDLVITELGDIDISKLYGFDFRLEKYEQNGEEYTVSGEVIQVTENDNFALRALADRRLALKVSNLKVRKSNLRNASNIPIAVPVTEQITFVNQKTQIRAFEHYNAELMGESSGIVLNRLSSDSTGTIQGKVRLVDNSFNFPTSYMTIEKTDFYLGNYGDTDRTKKMVLDVFRTGNEALSSKYSISRDRGEAISFKYLGFDGVSDTKDDRESFMDKEGAHLFLTLNPKIQGGLTISMEAGKAQITHDGIRPLTGMGEVTINLDKWKIVAKSWNLAPNSGGIILNNSTLFTGRADIALRKISIIPGELIFQDADPNDLRDKLYLGGTAKVKLNMMSGTEAVLIYDPDVGRIAGKGHFKFTLTNRSGEAAYVSGLEGMTRSSDKIIFEYVSILSNEEELTSFKKNAAPITLYNQASFRPVSFFSATDRVVFTGSTNLHIPKAPDNINTTLSYYAEDGGRNRMVMSHLDFSFIGDGGTEFRTISKGKNDQLFNAQGLGIAGVITLPKSDQKIYTHLVSMVTDEVTGRVAAEVKKQTEILLGNFKSEAENFAANMVDEVLNDPAISGMRDEIIGFLDQGQSTYGQAMAMAESGSQLLADLAGRMRLAGQGLGVVNSLIDGNPIGSMMQLNGLIEGVTGINVKDAAEQKVKQVAMQTVKAVMEELPVDNLADGLAGGNGGFSGSKFDFDFKSGRVTGSLSMPLLTAGVVTLNNIQIEMLFEPKGWYFFAGAKVTAPVPIIFPVDVGIGIGYYPELTPQIEQQMTSRSYVKKLPSTFHSNGLRGFLITGRRDFLPEFKIKFGVGDFAAFALGIPNVEVGASVGLDARIYGNFAARHQQISIGAMLFAHAYAKVTHIGCSISGDVRAEVGVKATFTNSSDNGFSLDAKGCFSAAVAAELDCTLFSKGFDMDVMGLLTLCVGGGCTKGVDFEFTKGSGSCSNSDAFDY